MNDADFEKALNELTDSEQRARANLTDASGYLDSARRCHDTHHPLAAETQLAYASRLLANVSQPIQTSDHGGYRAGYAAGLASAEDVIKSLRYEIEQLKSAVPAQSKM